MGKKEKMTDVEDKIKKELADLRSKLKKESKKPKPKKESKKPKPKKESKKSEPKKESKKPKPKKSTIALKPKKAAKTEKAKAKKAAKAEKEKAKADADAKVKAEADAKAEAEEKAKTPEEEMEEQLSDEQIRNFQIEKIDMDKITNKVCEIVAVYEDDGMLQSDLWKKLKLSSRDGSRLALRLERRGLISREKILQKGRWTYKLIIEQTPISLESLQNSPCLVCPVEQKCDIENVYPEPSPRYCQLIEDWVITEFSKKKK